MEKKMKVNLAISASIFDLIKNLSSKADLNEWSKDWLEYTIENKLASVNKYNLYNVHCTDLKYIYCLDKCNKGVKKLYFENSKSEQLFKKNKIRRYSSSFIKNPDHINYLGDYLRSYGNKVNLELLKKYEDLLKNQYDAFYRFQVNVELNNEQMEFLLDTFVTIAKKNKVEIVNFNFEYFDECNELFNSIILYTRCGDVDLLVDMEFELVKKIAKNVTFIGKRFSPSFEYLNKD